MSLPLEGKRNSVYYPGLSTYSVTRPTFRFRPLSPGPGLRVTFQHPFGKLGDHVPHGPILLFSTEVGERLLLPLFITLLQTLRELDDSSSSDVFVFHNNEGSGVVGPCSVNSKDVFEGVREVYFLDRLGSGRVGQLKGFETS